MKKVWILNSVRWNSAISEYALNLTRSISSHYDVTVSLLAGRDPARKAASFGIKTVDFENFSILNILKFKQLEQKIKPDIVICFNGPESFLSRFLPGYVKVIRFKGRDDDVNRPLDGFLTKISNSFIDRFIFPCDLIASGSRLNSDSYKTIYLGCDSEKFTPNVCDYPKRPTLLLLGRLDPIKGHFEFIDFFSTFLSKTTLVPKPVLKIIGKDANLSAKKIRDYAISKGLRLNEDFIIINEFVENISEHKNSASVGIISSLGSEVICRVSEEFLLSGVPIFVSNVGSLSECLFSDLAGKSFCYSELKNINE